MKHVAPLHYDVIFKKAFSVPENFSAFASDFLGMKIEVDYVETEKRFAMPIFPIEPRFDLYAEDKKNRLIIDIQQQRYPDHYDRFLYYHCVALLEQAAQSKSYRPPLQVFTLVVLTSGDKHKTDIAVIDFGLKDLQGNKLNEINHKVMYICPKYANEETPPLLREWMQAIEDTFDEEVEESHYRSEIQKVFERIEKSRVTPQDNARMKDEYAQQEIIREKDIRLNHLLSTQMQTVKNMVDKGFSVEQIAEIMGLSSTEIQNLRSEVSENDDPT